MHRFIFMSLGLCAPQGEAPTPTSGDPNADDPMPPAEAPLAPAEALKVVKNKTLPLGQRLSVAINALSGVDPTGQLANVQAELTSTKDQLKTVQGELDTANGEITRLKAELTARETDVSTLEASNAALEKDIADLRAKEQDLEKRSTAKANEKLASLGYPASQLPKATTDVSVAGSKEEKIAALQKQSDQTTDPVEKGRLSQQIWDLMKDNS